MRHTIAVAVAALLLTSVPAVAQEEGRRGGGTRGALIGALAGTAAATVYGLATDYCRNPVGEYTEQDQAKLCVAPIAGMIGAGALAGYLIGREEPAPAAERVRPDVPLSGQEIAALAARTTLTARRASRPEARLFSSLFAPGPPARE